MNMGQIVDGLEIMRHRDINVHIVRYLEKSFHPATQVIKGSTGDGHNTLSNMDRKAGFGYIHAGYDTILCQIILRKVIEVRAIDRKQLVGNESII